LPDAPSASASPEPSVLDRARRPGHALAFIAVHRAVLRVCCPSRGISTSSCQPGPDLKPRCPVARGKPDCRAGTVFGNRLFRLLPIIVRPWSMWRPLPRVVSADREPTGFVAPVRRPPQALSSSADAPFCATYAPMLGPGRSPCNSTATPTGYSAAAHSAGQLARGHPVTAIPRPVYGDIPYLIRVPTPV